MFQAWTNITKNASSWDGCKTVFNKIFTQSFIYNLILPLNIEADIYDYV